MEPVANLPLAVEGFTDLHLNMNHPERSLVFPGPRRVTDDELDTLRDFVRVVAGIVPNLRDPSASFLIEHNDTRFRAQLIDGLDGPRYALRVMAEIVPTLPALGFQPGQVAQLTAPDLRRRGGLVLIGGAGGAGKSTSAAAMVTALLEAYGGYCITAEDPPELPIDGFHGAGYCEQTYLVGHPHDYLRSILRAFPSADNSILFFGEVLDKRAAAELLRIALDGHLVISTIHAGDLQETVQRILSLASLDGEADARVLLAKSLRMVVHQRLDAGVLQASIMHVDDTLSATIRSGGSIADAARRALTNRAN